MRRLFVALLSVVLVALLVPATALAAKPVPQPPTANAFVYLGQSGDLVGPGDYYTTPPAGWSVWNTRDHEKDFVFELDLAPTTSFDLASLNMTGPGTWDTVADNGMWAIGVTTTLQGKVTLINNADSSINAMDVTNGLRLYLHMAGGLYLGAGEYVTINACSDAGCTSANLVLALTM